MHERRLSFLHTSVDPLCLLRCYLTMPTPAKVDPENGSLYRAGYRQKERPSAIDKIYAQHRD